MFNEVGVILRYIIERKSEYTRLNSHIVNAVKAGQKVFDKYYRLMLNNNVYLVATVLDPRIKLKWIRENIKNPNHTIERVRSFLKALYPPPDTDLPANTEDSAF